MFALKCKILSTSLHSMCLKNIQVQHIGQPPTYLQDDIMKTGEFKEKKLRGTRQVKYTADSHGDTQSTQSTHYLV